jgi:hypothetical protein
MGTASSSGSNAMETGVHYPAGTHWRYQGSVALSVCTTLRPIYTRFAQIFGAFASATTMRPNPVIVHRDLR